MRILFIGGTGEISRACVEQSILAGHQVIVFNRGRSAEAPLPGVEQIIGDLHETQAYAALAQLNCDVICQFLAYEPADIARDLALFSGHCGQYIFISTASVYAKPLPVSIIDERCPVGNPFWDYSQKKQASETALLAAHADGRIAATIVRPSHTYRLRLPSIVISGDHLAWRILNSKPVPVPADGQSVWTVTHASDFARAFVALFGKPATYGEIFQITERHGHTWNRLLETAAQAIGHPAHLIPVRSKDLVACNPAWRGPLLGDKANTMIFDNTKIGQIADGWHCTVTLKDGIRGAWQATAQRLNAGFQPDPEIDRLIDRIVCRYSRHESAIICTEPN